MHYDLLLQLLAAHFLSDFFLQTTGWVVARNKLHFRAWQLYLHGIVTAGIVVILCGTHLWLVGIIIGMSHVALDGAKSFLKQNMLFFLADQALHLAILALCWAVFTGVTWDPDLLNNLYHHPGLWLYLCAVLFLTAPSGLLVEFLTTRWRVQISKLKSDSSSLEKAGMLIGIIERLLIFFLVIIGKFEAIGLLIAAKSLLRFNEKDRPEEKTEYLLVGTLISVALALGTGFLVANIHFIN
jgi:hypothetical protein